MLRYGDGTPFPFGEDFLEILVDAVDACTAMFEAADELDERRAQARESRRDLDSEERRLELLEKSIAMAIAPAEPSTKTGASVTQRAAQKALAAVRKTIDASRAQLDKRRAAEAAEPRADHAHIHDIAARFFERRCLPQTRWAWSWYATCGDATAESGKFAVTYDLELAPAWRAPVRIDTLAAGAVARLPQPRMFGAPVVRAVALDRLWLVGASEDADGTILAIRERPQAARGWRLTLPVHGQASCVAVDRNGRDVGGAHELVRDAALERLVDAVEAAILEMRRTRRAREIRLGGEPLGALADVAAAARAIIEQLAPTIRTIRAKSRVPGELSLKRDVSAGVREELFVPRATITSRYANLSADYKAILDDTGLGRALTNTLSSAATIPRMYARATSVSAVA